MFIYTTCRDCGGLLHVTNHDIVHPSCTAPHQKLRQLERLWLLAVLNGDNETETRLQLEIDELDDRPPRLLDAAVAYASWGWPVFPLKPQSKQPATRHGFKDATTDQTRVAAWWTRHPHHNIGLPTGLAFDVIDIDVPAGPLSFAKMLTTVDPRTGHGPALPDCHGWVATANGGTHLYIRPAGNTNKAGLMPGIDIRGKGGYVVAPPSTLGPPYRSWSWAVHPSPIITNAKAYAA